jgi:hypothetical protein
MSVETETPRLVSLYNYLNKNAYHIGKLSTGHNFVDDLAIFRIVILCLFVLVVLCHPITNKEKCNKDGKYHFELTLTPIKPLTHDKKCNGEILGAACYQKTQSV